jgi:hypothetical protein
MEEWLLVDMLACRSATVKAIMLEGKFARLRQACLRA